MVDCQLAPVKWPNAYNEFSTSNRRDTLMQFQNTPRLWGWLPKQPYRKVRTNSILIAFEGRQVLAPKSQQLVVFGQFFENDRTLNSSVRKRIIRDLGTLVQLSPFGR